MLMLNPWRLSLLFLVAGFATRFMLRKYATGALLQSRTVRLLVPLALPIADGAGRRLAVAVALSPAESMLRVMQSVVLHDDTAVLVLGADGSPRAAWRSRTGHVNDAAGFATLSDLARRVELLAGAGDR